MLGRNSKLDVIASKDDFEPFKSKPITLLNKTIHYYIENNRNGGNGNEWTNKHDFQPLKDKYHKT